MLMRVRTHNLASATRQRWAESAFQVSDTAEIEEKLGFRIRSKVRYFKIISIRFGTGVENTTTVNFTATIYLFKQTVKKF